MENSRDIRRLFRKRRLSGKAWEYIDELNLHVFEMRYLPEETRELFQSDMRIVVDFLAKGDGYRSQRKIVHKAALIRMIKVLSGETDIEDVEAWMEKQGVREEDEVTVCELFDQYVRQGREEGRAEGRVEGRAEGLAEGLSEGRTEGLAEGLREGRVEGENRFAKLVQMLMDGGRSEELRRAVSDQNYREHLYAEAGLA